MHQNIILFLVIIFYSFFSNMRKKITLWNLGQQVNHFLNVTVVSESDSSHKFQCLSANSGRESSNKSQLIYNNYYKHLSKHHVEFDKFLTWNFQATEIVELAIFINIFWRIFMKVSRKSSVTNNSREPRKSFSKFGQNERSKLGLNQFDGKKFTFNDRVSKILIFKPSWNSWEDFYVIS